MAKIYLKRIKSTHSCHDCFFYKKSNSCRDYYEKYKLPECVDKDKNVVTQYYIFKEVKRGKNNNDAD